MSVEPEDENGKNSEGLIAVINSNYNYGQAVSGQGSGVRVQGDRG